MKKTERLISKMWENINLHMVIIFLSDTERLILGEKISSWQRSVFKEDKNDGEWVSGSVGFLDFAHKDNMIFVSTMGVESEYQKQGFGAKLIEKVEEIAKERKAEAIKFIAVRMNNIGMVKLLGNYGYYPTRGGA